MWDQWAKPSAGGCGWSGPATPGLSHSLNGLRLPANTTTNVNDKTGAVRHAIIWKTTLLDFGFREGLAQVHDEDLRGKLPGFSRMRLMSKYPTEWQRLLTLMTSRRATLWPSAPYCRYKWCDEPGAASQGPREGRCTAVQQHLKVPPEWRTNKHTLEQTEAGQKNFTRPLTEAA